MAKCNHPKIEIIRHFGIIGFSYDVIVNDNLVGDHVSRKQALLLVKQARS